MIMNAVLPVLGALGGTVVFCTAALTVIRGIFRQVHAVEDNTKALGDVQEAIEKLSAKLQDHSERIIRLEARR